MWAEAEIRLGQLPAKSEAIPEAVLYRGEPPRAGQVSHVHRVDLELHA
jgi:hypothetical protein